MSRAQQIVAEKAPNTEVSNIQKLKSNLPPNMIKNYDRDQMFGPIYRATRGIRPKDETQKDRLLRISPDFEMDNDLLYYQKTILISRKNVINILKLAHDCKAAGHFSSAKTLARLNNVHWKGKTKDVEEYCFGCLKCQQMKDGRTKPLGLPQPLELPSRRWGFIAMNFITHLSLTNKGFDTITTFVDCMTKLIHLVASRATNSAKWLQHFSVPSSGITAYLTT